MGRGLLLPRWLPIPHVRIHLTNPSYPLLRLAAWSRLNPRRPRSSAAQVLQRTKRAIAAVASWPGSANIRRVYGNSQFAPAGGRTESPSRPKFTGRGSKTHVRECQIRTDARSEERLGSSAHLVTRARSELALGPHGRADGYKGEGRLVIMSHSLSSFSMASQQKMNIETRLERVPTPNSDLYRSPTTAVGSSNYRPPSPITPTYATYSPTRISRPRCVGRVYHDC